MISVVSPVYNSEKTIKKFILTLVKHLKINVPSFDECTFENGIQKWNICCIGKLKINKGIGEIN